jgi:hypothetical protein
MGWMTGFEPATSGSTIRRSNQLSYTHHSETRGDPAREGLWILAKKEESPQPNGNVSSPGIEGCLHFRENCGGSGSGIRGIPDGSADH